MDEKMNCPNKEDHERRIGKLEERYDELKEQFWEFDKKSEVTFAKVTSALENLADLPKAMTDMTNTMIAMNDAIADNGTKTDELSKTVNSLSSKVQEMDNRDRFSMLEFFKKNWPIVVALILFAGYVAADAAKGLLS